MSALFLVWHWFTRRPIGYPKWLENGHGTTCFCAECAPELHTYKWNRYR